MRIISGTARGRKLAEFKSEDIRPTPDRVKEALFSMLVSHFGSLAGLRVLELFAGSGTLSLEALSRGADSAVAVDSGPAAIKLIKENSTRCHLSEQIEVIQAKADSVIPSLSGRPSFDLILLDPPYNKGLIPKALAWLVDLQLLSQNGIICAEAEHSEDFDLPSALERQDRRHYGRSEIHIIQHRSGEAS